MRVARFRRFSDDDYPGAQDWFLNFLDNINPMIDALNPLLANNITLDDNIASERQTVLLTHGVPILIKLQKLKLVPRLVRVAYAAGYVGVAGITTYMSDGSFYITCFFQGTPPTAAVSTMLIFEP